ncbi:UNVERIFIED_CONTAM: hypothetical protein Sangu_3147400 [Sesamum angustifolium]|uniref:Uncharacterized protein n=1 Tax=Sesamum angustifolium TaxID=2727405 RepID=A0AAW2JZ17_9LAMI
MTIDALLPLERGGGWGRGPPSPPPAVGADASLAPHIGTCAPAAADSCKFPYSGVKCAGA